MPRLLDKLRHERWHIPTGIGSNYHVEPLKTALSFAEAIVADNVAREYFEVMPKEVLHMSDDCPNATPPFTYTWVETRAPTVVRVGKKISQWRGPSEWGFLFTVEDLFSCSPEDRSMHMTDMIDGRLRWSVTGHLFCGEDLGANMHVVDCLGKEIQKGVNGPLGSVSLPLDNEGRFMDGLWAPRGAVSCDSFMGNSGFAPGLSEEIKERLAGEGRGDWFEDDDGQESRDVVVGLLHPIWLSLSFSNCKNIDLVPGRARRATRKRWKKKTGKELMTYRTIQLGGRTARREARNAKNGKPDRVALHLVRGHFKTFTDERPLGGLGGAVGTYWWQQQMRGTKEEGVIVHDYNISPPEDST
jgi:hypothetical protein